MPHIESKSKYLLLAGEPLDPYDRRIKKLMSLVDSFMKRQVPFIVEIGPGPCRSPLTTCELKRKNVISFDVVSPSSINFLEQKSEIGTDPQAFYVQLPIDFPGNGFLYGKASRVQLIAPDSRQGHGYHITKLIEESSHICKPGGNIVLTGDGYYLHSDNIQSWFEQLLDQNPRLHQNLLPFSIDYSLANANRNYLTSEGIGESRMFDRYFTNPPGIIRLTKNG